MSSIQQIDKTIEDFTFMQTMVDAYEEIAANRMRRIRDSVLQSRTFLTGLNKVLQEVKASYKQQLVALMKQKKVNDLSRLSLVNKNGKTLAVFLSANTGLYGDIILQTYREFDEYVTANKVDIAIMGKRGKALFEQHHPGVAFTYFEFPDDAIDAQLVKKIIPFALGYEKLFVFFPEFKSLISQVPTILDVYGTQPGVEQLDKAPERYIFEPSLENIVIFFESEIFAAIFEQTMYEANLAKFAARMYSLDKASLNVKASLQKGYNEKRQYQHRMANKKQLEGLAGMLLWKTRV